MTKQEQLGVITTDLFMEALSADDCANNCDDSEKLQEAAHALRRILTLAAKALDLVEPDTSRRPNVVPLHTGNIVMLDPDGKVIS